MAYLYSLVESKPSLFIALFAITFNPTAWNLVARNGDFSSQSVYRRRFLIPATLEYRNKTITRFFGGNSHYGCYFLTVVIFSFGILRDSLYVFRLMPVRIDRVCNSFLLNICDRYHRALMEQPRKEMLPEPFATLIPAVLFVVGQTFVITSTWALGITGTFLGDYFGIFMDRRVEGSVNCVLRSIQSS